METKINDRLDRMEQMLSDLHKLLVETRQDSEIQKTRDLIDSGMDSVAACEQYFVTRKRS